MNFISLSALLSLCTFSLSLRQDAEPISSVIGVLDSNPNAAKKLATLLSLGVLQRFQDKVQKQTNNRIPVIPEFPEDELLIKDTHIEFSPESPLSSIILGEVNFCDSTLKNMSTIKDDISLKNVDKEMYIIYRLDAADLSTHGLHSIALRFLESTTLSGFGVYDVSLLNGFFGMEMHVEVNVIDYNITLREVILDAGFESLTVHSEESSLDGVLIDWDEFNSQIKEEFDSAWAMIKGILEPALPQIFNYLLRDCTLDELLSGDLSCISIGEKEYIELREEELRHVLRFDTSDIEFCQNVVPVPTLAPGITSTTGEGTPSGSTEALTESTSPGTGPTSGDGTPTDSTGAQTSDSSPGPTEAGPTSTEGEEEKPTTAGALRNFFNLTYFGLLVLPIFYI